MLASFKPQSVSHDHRAFFLQVEKLQQSVLSLEAEAELLRSQLAAVSQEKLSHVQDATELQRKLQEAQSRVRPPPLTSPR